MVRNNGSNKKNSSPAVSEKTVTPSTELQIAPSDWKLLLDKETIARCVSRITYEILEKNRDLNKLAVVGIRTCGEHLAKRIRDRISEIEGVQVPFGIIDITLYRDDLTTTVAQPTLKGTDLPFAVSGSTIILVDDVAFTGRTVRAALDAIIDFGRPKSVQLAVLIDRGHRELPIRPDFAGKNIPTNRYDFVKVRLEEQGHHDGVYLVHNRRDRGPSDGGESEAE